MVELCNEGCSPPRPLGSRLYSEGECKPTRGSNGWFCDWPAGSSVRRPWSPAFGPRTGRERLTDTGASTSWLFTLKGDATP